MEGFHSVRNLGIKKASKKYVAFIDSDDFIDEKVFEELLKKRQ